MENFLKDHKGQFKTTYMEGFGDDENNQPKVSDLIVGIKYYQMVGFNKLMWKESPKLSSLR